ncbi:hypothetical protein NFI96_001609, partial [Prochilodus magdalenae]
AGHARSRAGPAHSLHSCLPETQPDSTARTARASDTPCAFWIPGTTSTVLRTAQVIHRRVVTRWWARMERSFPEFRVLRAPRARRFPVSLLSWNNFYFSSSQELLAASSTTTATSLSSGRVNHED